jgi:hypothetical protein
MLATSGPVAGGKERTIRVIGPMGKNFTLTMLRLHRERGASGQAATLAAACWRLVTAEVQEPLLHWCDAGAGESAHHGGVSAVGPAVQLLPTGVLGDAPSAGSACGAMAAELGQLPEAVA